MEIIVDALSLCERKMINKTGIMYGANLSYSQLVRYPTFIVDRGLVEENDSGLFQLTTKGHETLGQLKRVVTILHDLEHDIDEGELGN